MRTLAIGYVVSVKEWARANGIQPNDLRIVHSLQDVLGYSPEEPVYLVGRYHELTGVHDLIKDIEAHGYRTEKKYV